MATSKAKGNFFQEHWDWLVAAAGVAAFLAAVALTVSALGESPDDARSSYQSQLNAVTPKHEGVAPADLDALNKAYRLVKTPPALHDIDPRKASFLASEARVICQKADESAEGKACGRPIPALAESCPFCGTKQHVVKVEADSDHDGLPNDWEVKYGLNPNDPTDADKDKDGDGFTNKEEYLAKTDPTDPKSHPDYLESLSIAGAIQQTFLPFWFKAYSPVPGGFRFTFQRVDKDGKDVKGYSASLFAKKDEPVGNTGFVVTAFTQKTEMRAIRGSSNKRTVDVSEVELTRKTDGKKLVAVMSVRRIPIEAQVELAYDRNVHSWKKTVAIGTEIDCNGEKYVVKDLKPAGNGCELTLSGVGFKKEKTIR